MAQTSEREKGSGAGSEAPARETTSGQPQGNWGQRLGLTRLLTPATGDRSPRVGPDGKPARGSTIKLFTGLLVFVLGTQFFAYVEAIVDAKFFQGRLETTRLAPPNTLVLGGLTPFLLIYLIAVIGVWVILYRLKIIPKDLFGARAAAEARRNAATAATVTSTVGKKRTRAERRRAATANATTATSVKGGTAKGGSSSATRPPAARPERAVTVGSGKHDDAYERVRAAQKNRQRRAARR